MDVNDRVVLEVPDGPWAGEYPTRVEQIWERRLALAAPRVRGVLMVPPEGTELYVTALRVDPVGGARYRARTRAVGGIEQDQEARLIVVEVLEWERIQMRSFIRAPAIVRVRYRPLGEGDRHKGRWQTAETRDVGGGGVLLWLKEPLEPSTLVEMVIELPRRPVRAVGEVVRVVEPPSEPAMGTGVAVRFAQISEADRDRIIGFVLRRQAEIRRMQTG